MIKCKFTALFFNKLHQKFLKTLWQINELICGSSLQNLSNATAEIPYLLFNFMSRLEIVL